MLDLLIFALRVYLKFHNCKDTVPVFKLVRYEQEFLRCCSEIIAEQEKDQPGCAPLLKALLMKLIIIFSEKTLSMK